MERVKENKRKTIPAEREVQYIPEPILLDILARLPTKYLLRFKTVCKNWCTMISQPDFQKFHLQQCLSKILIIYHIPAAPRCQNVVYKLEGKGLRARKFSDDLNFGGHNIRATRSCNSLILLQNYSDDRRLLYVYDALSHQKMSLPCIPVSDKNNYAFKCSLVYDSTINKYKVVVFATSISRLKFEYCYIYRLGRHLTLPNNENWRMLTPPFSQTIVSDSNPVAVGKVLYWLAYTAQPFHEFIQSMNIETEEFMGRIEVPCDPSPSWLSKGKLLTMKGSLCVVDEGLFGVLYIWVLKNSALLQGGGGWIMQHKLSRRYISRILLAVEGLKTTYLLVAHYRKVYWCNLNTERGTPIAVDEFNSLSNLFFASVIN